MSVRDVAAAAAGGHQLESLPTQRPAFIHQRTMRKCIRTVHT